MTEAQQSKRRRQSVECDICGRESEIPVGQHFANCPGSECGGRRLLPPLQYSNREPRFRYIRLVCCGEVTYGFCGIDQIVHFCCACRQKSRIIAEVRCKQLVYETEMIETFPVIVEQLREHVKLLNNELQTRKDSTMEVIRLRLELNLANNRISINKNSDRRGRDPEGRRSSDKACPSDAKRHRPDDSHG